MRKPPLPSSNIDDSGFKHLPFEDDAHSSYLIHRPAYHDSITEDNISESGKFLDTWNRALLDSGNQGVRPSTSY